jgi:AraC family transcriptional regulator
MLMQSGRSQACEGRISPEAWSQTFSGAPVVSSDQRRLRNALLRHWTGTSPDMPQPALDHHLVVLHLGGAKRVERRGEEAAIVADVALGAVTFIPSGASFHWRTTGPIEFAHLYFTPARFEQCIVETFDREPSVVEMRTAVGKQDPVLHALFRAMLDEVGSEGLSGLYLDTLFEAALVRVIRSHSTLGEATIAARQALAPHRLRRVQEYVEANLEMDIDLQMLAEAAGLSRFYFCRVFQRATGQTPQHYVTARRIERAKRLMCETRASLQEIAAQTGFRSPAQFSTAFSRLIGLSPSAWRNQR